MSDAEAHPFVHFREAPAELDAHVREAVLALGYFEYARVGELIAVFRALWPRGCSSQTLIYNDFEPMNPEEKAAVGAPRHRVPRVVWDLLTEKGRRDVMHAVKTTTLRVKTNLQRAEEAAQDEVRSTIIKEVVFSTPALPCFHCPASRRHVGTVVLLRDRFPLPLPDCDKEWCPCTWLHHSNVF